MSSTDQVLNLMALGFQYKTLYNEVKPLIQRGKYEFVRGKHLYFGTRKRVNLFGCELYAYIYVDRTTAVLRHREDLMKHPEKFENMTDKERDWETVRSGFFILLATEEMDPKDLLDHYFERTDIEGIFKTSKEYLDLLPLNKWSDTTVRGKILNDCIATIIYTQYRTLMNQLGYSVTEAFGKCRSLMCLTEDNGTVHIETPNRQVKEIYKKMKVEIPGIVQVEDIKKALHL